MTAYGVLSRGLLTGSLPQGKQRLPRSHARAFRDENLAQNRQLIEALNNIAAAHNVTPTQLAIAWVMARGENVVPVIGARTRLQLEESLGALTIHLSSDELTAIEQAVPGRGRRRPRATTNVR